MDTTETFFGEHPPRDGKSYDCCCARCGGSCEWQECECGNDAKWCEANPLPGRESVKRGTLEWFRDYEEER